MSAHGAGVAFRELLGSGGFAYGAELVSTRGLPNPDAPGSCLGAAGELAGDRRIGWLSITDSPGGTPMLPPDYLARLLMDHRRRVVLHVTCKDMNRNGLETTLWRYAAEGFDNILALTGDLSGEGFGGRAPGVFDLDSVGLIALARAMNDGLAVRGRRGDPERLPGTHFFTGCVVSPFKRHERELLPQYFKLLRKLAAGAQWVIPQLGYDMRKFHEMMSFLRWRGSDVPVIGNVYVLNRTVAELFHQGRLPGCVVSDALIEMVRRYAAGPDKGRAFFRELAAKQLAVFKGLGCAGGYLAGIAKPETFFEIIDLAEGFAPHDWRAFAREIRFGQPGEFYLFEEDPATGLADPQRLNAAYLRALEHPAKSAEVGLSYRLSRRVHDWLFTRGRGLYGLARRLYRRWEERPGTLSRLAYSMERFSKAALYGCQDCGDCSLPDCAYLCPMRACSKHSRNGPCGGSREGRCELGDKECLWARAYERLKHYGESETMLAGPPVLYRAELLHTSSWANTYLDRDHHAPPGTAPVPPAEPPPNGPPSADTAVPPQAGLDLPAGGKAKADGQPPTTGGNDALRPGIIGPPVSSSPP